jgi:inhibitor of cysteine peptidase
MRKTGIILCLLILAILAVGALWLWRNSVRTDETIKFKKDVLTVTLRENPTTGYVWSYTIQGSGIETLDDAYKPDANNKNYTGVGGTHIFRFTGVSEGTSRIEMVESRPWEEGAVSGGLVIEVETDSDGIILSAGIIDL